MVHFSNYLTELQSRKECLGGEYYSAVDLGVKSGLHSTDLIVTSVYHVQLVV